MSDNSDVYNTTKPDQKLDGFGLFVSYVRKLDFELSISTLQESTDLSRHGQEARVLINIFAVLEVGEVLTYKLLDAWHLHI